MRRCVAFAAPEKDGNDSIGTDAETNCDRMQKILDRVDKGNSHHCIFAHACNENTVNNIIEGIDEHGKHHRDTHTQQQ